MDGKTIIGGILVAAALLLPASSSEACTNVIITPGASADGSVLVSYAPASHGPFGALSSAPAPDCTPGSMR